MVSKVNTQKEGQHTGGKCPIQCLCLIFFYIILGVHPIMGLLFKILLVWLNIVLMQILYRYTRFFNVEPLTEYFGTALGTLAVLPSYLGPKYHGGSDLTNIRVTHVEVLNKSFLYLLM